MTLDEFKKQYVNTNVFTNEITADAKSVLQVLTEFEAYIKAHAIQGPTGSAGISITNVELEDKGNNLYQLNVTLSDGSTVNAGTFTAAPGPKGDRGDTGETGATPNISATATTLPAGSSASVTKSGTAENPVFTFGIPKGETGEPGPIGPAGPAGSATADDITIDQPESATNGTLSASQLATLQASKLNGIIFANERYILQDNQHESGFLVYSHVGHDSTGNFFVKCITITISTLAWVLSSTPVGAGGGDIEVIKINDFTELKNTLSSLSTKVFMCCVHIKFDIPFMRLLTKYTINSGSLSLDGGNTVSLYLPSGYYNLPIYVNQNDNTYHLVINANDIIGEFILDSNTTEDSVKVVTSNGSSIGANESSDTELYITGSSFITNVNLTPRIDYSNLYILARK